MVLSGELNFKEKKTLEMVIRIRSEGDLGNNIRVKGKIKNVFYFSFIKRPLRFFQGFFHHKN